MKIALICNKEEPRMPLGDIFSNVLNSFENIDVIHFNLNELKNIEDKCDLYLRVGDDNYEKIPSNLYPVAWWINDTHLKKCYKKIIKRVFQYNYLFAAQKEGVKKIIRDTGKEIYWIPWCCKQVCSDFKFVIDKYKKWDICFIGTSGKYSLRRVFIEIIRENYPNSFIGRANWEKLIGYYSKSRIVVNYSINNDINPRIFEAMSAGSLVITNRINNNGFNEIFQEGKHLVIYDDILKDMKEKMDYYLQNKEERERIAYNGFKYVNSNHTYRHRLEEMFRIMRYPLEK